MVQVSADGTKVGGFNGPEAIIRQWDNETDDVSARSHSVSATAADQRESCKCRFIIMKTCSDLTEIAIELLLVNNLLVKSVTPERRRGAGRERWLR